MRRLKAAPLAVVLLGPSGWLLWFFVGRRDATGDGQPDEARSRVTRPV